MLKVSNVLLKVAAILGTVVGALFLAMCPVFLVVAFSSHIHDLIDQAARDGSIYSTTLSTDEIATVVQLTFGIIGFAFLVIGVVFVINAMIAAKTRNEPTRERYIACIVTGAITSQVSIVAGIFGLILLSKKQPKVELEKDEF